MVKVDVCAAWKGYCADMARAYLVEVTEPSAEMKRFVETAKQALQAGIDQAFEGNRLFDISYAIQQVTEQQGYGIVRDFAGHGIGKKMHEEPDVPNFGKQGTGPRLKSGMVLAIEPMINEGGYEVEVLSDGWTAVTKDRKLSAHFEHTVAVTDGEPRILT